MNHIKQVATCMTIAIAFGVSPSQAADAPFSQVVTTGNNFTMVGPTNGLIGGANDVTFTWNGTARSSVVTDGSYNATLSSPTKFGGKNWTAHNVNIYSPGSYTFNTGCAVGNPSCGIGPSYTLTVGAGQVGAHMLFDWHTHTNIDIVLLWNMNNSWAGTGTSSAFNTGGGNTIYTVWNGVSIDTTIDADAFNGTQMIDGPFVGQNANFNVNGIHAVPVPASLWLMSSGLLGLIGVTRRKAA